VNLLLVLAFPDDGSEEADPDMVADILASIVNDERRRNADEAGQPDYYKPVMVSAIPAPQWLSGWDLSLLVRAAQLVQSAQERLTDLDVPVEVEAVES
jgi:hypothetical protein